MIACVIVLSSIGVLSLFFGGIVPKTKNNKILYLILCAVVIILQMGLRDASIQLTGVYDVKVYFSACKQAMKYSFVDYLSIIEKDYGYYIFNWVVAHVFKNAQVLLFLVAIIICFFTFRFIYKYSTNVYLSVFLFLTLGFYGFSLTAFRQSIAIAICLWAYDYIKKKKVVPFVLITLLAASFHQTAIVFLPMYIIGQLKLNKNNVFIVAILLMITFVCGDMFVGFFNELFKMDYGKEEVVSLIGRVKEFLIEAIIFLLLYFSLKEKNLYERLLIKSRTDTMTYSLMIGIMCHALQFKVLIMQRITKYFISSVNYVLVPNVTKSFKDESIVAVLNVCFVMFSTILFLVGIYRNNLYEFAYIL